MERELLITGIGGQGVQLAAQVLARGATLEGREVMFFGVYGGMMRGGNTDSTVVVGDAPIAGAAGRVAHVVGDRDARRVLGAGRARSCGRAASCSSTTRRSRARSTRRCDRAPRRRDRASRPSSATRSAASMVMVGAYAAITGLVGCDALVEAMRAVDPAVPHAAHRHERSARCAPGWDLLPANAFPAWEAARAEPDPTTRRSRVAAPSPSTSSTARAASCASPRARRRC